VLCVQTRPFNRLNETCGTAISQDQASFKKNPGCSGRENVLRKLLRISYRVINRRAGGFLHSRPQSPSFLGQGVYGVYGVYVCVYGCLPGTLEHVSSVRPIGKFPEKVENLKR